jgi:hypothetical protein
MRFGTEPWKSVLITGQLSWLMLTSRWPQNQDKDMYGLGELSIGLEQFSFIEEIIACVLKLVSSPSVYPRLRGTDAKIKWNTVCVKWLFLQAYCFYAISHCLVTVHSGTCSSSDTGRDVWPPHSTRCLAGIVFPSSTCRCRRIGFPRPHGSRTEAVLVASSWCIRAALVPELQYICWR